MNSFRMKALSLAVLGLAGFGMVGSAFAACPTADQTKGVLHSPGGGGAWTSQFIANDASLSIVAPGLNSTGCALQVSVGAISNSRAFVEDDSPANETRYRGRFYLSIPNLPTFGGVSNQTGVIFAAQDATAPAQFSSNQLVIRLVGGATPTVRFFFGDLNAASGSRVLVVPAPASATNTYRIEFDMQLGIAATSGLACTAMPAAGNGCVRVWVNDAGTDSSDAAPTQSATTNFGSGGTLWGGPDKVFFGLQTTSLAFRGAHAGTTIQLDEFDSRRQTFIGK